MKKIIRSLLILLMQFCFAQDGHIDVTFNPGDRGNGYGDGMFTCTAMALLSNGKVLLGSNENLYNGKYEKSFFRVNADGSADATFNTDGTGPMFGAVNAVVVLSGGKILIAGSFTNYNGTSINRIARLNTDGTLDETFNVGEGADEYISSMALLPNGKIVITGEFTKYNNISRTRIAVLNADGSLYTAFNPNSGPEYPVEALAVQADGKILISGNFTFYNVTPVSSLVRINANGSIDNTFTPPNYIRGKISVLPSGKILGINSDGDIYRLNSTGILDNSFNFSYTGTEYDCLNIYPLPNGKIMASVLFKNSLSTIDDDVIKLVRLNSDGSSDNTFYIGSGTITAYYLDKYAVQPDGRLLVGGFFVYYNEKVVRSAMRLYADGTYDPSFNGGTTGSDGEVNDIMLQPDGKIIIEGTFSEYNDVPTRLARLNANGTIDTSFACNISTYANPRPINALALQPDGKILVGGNTFLGSGGSNTFKRLNSDGSIDSSFNYTIITETINAIAVQPDGKILISGKFPTFFPFPSDYKVVRVNANGTVDTTFDANSKGNSYIYNIIIQPDGKIVLSGAFTTYNNTIAVHMVRLEANGTIDTTFNVGLGFDNMPNSIVLQPDNKIVACGSFSSFNGMPTNRLVRLNPNGTIDPTFNIGSGPSSSVYTIALQLDGKILAGGLFTTFNNQAKYFIVRLNSNGSLDNSFNTVGGGPDYRVSKIIMQADGKPIIGGLFVNYNGIGRNRLARLNPVVLGTDEFNGLHQNVSVYPNPVKDLLHLEHATTIQNIAVLDLFGKMVIYQNVNAIQSELDMSGLDNALYFLKVTTADGIQNFKIIKE